MGRSGQVVRPTYVGIIRSGSPTLMVYACEHGPMRIRNGRRETLRLVIGMTAVARLLIGMRERETGTGYDATLADLGRQIQELFPGA